MKESPRGPGHEHAGAAREVGHDAHIDKARLARDSRGIVEARLMELHRISAARFKRVHRPRRERAEQIEAVRAGGRP